MAEPDLITRSYYVEERGRERRYYDDHRQQKLAIRATPRAITSRREDADTIRAMLSLAEARGWSGVVMSGSVEFRREAWIEARTRGLEAKGHKPSTSDRQDADKRRAERSRDVPKIARASASTPQQNAAAAPQADLHRAKPAGQDAAAKVRLASISAADPDPRVSLSADGRVVLAALSEKIDRQMDKLTADGKAELKAFAAAELAKKERAEGPIVLTIQQRRLAAAPEPPRQHARPPVQAEVRTPELEQPRRARGR